MPEGRDSQTTPAVRQMPDYAAAAERATRAGCEITHSGLRPCVAIKTASANRPSRGRERSHELLPGVRHRHPARGQVLCAVWYKPKRGPASLAGAAL
jgi:hypothetical protein